jgi:hypothetical protein
MSYAKELINKYIEKGLITPPEEDDEEFGWKQAVCAVIILAGFIIFTLLYFGNPEFIAFCRQI